MANTLEGKIAPSGGNAFLSELTIFDMGGKHEAGRVTVKIIKFGTPNTIAIIVLKLVKFDVTLH